MIELSVSSVLEELTAIIKGETPYPEKPYSYFARAIRGGRENLENCRIIVSEMENYSIVLSKHTVLDDVNGFEKEWKKRFPKINVNSRDKRMIRMSKRFVGDVTVETCGGGFEVAYAEWKKIPSALFCHEEARYTQTISSRVAGKIPIFYYNNQNIVEIAKREIRNLFTTPYSQAK
jgi:hypothetical protein